MLSQSRFGSLSESAAQAGDGRSNGPVLEDGDRVAVIGGGPAGSFFSYFLLRQAESLGLRLRVEIYEPRSFDRRGPAGCNHCGGIVSESLVQLLATEGINLPPGVVQRGIDSYVLHMDVGSVRIETPLQEQRIAAVFRGNGPRDSSTRDLESFDRYLQELAVGHGARLVRRLVSGVRRRSDRMQLTHAEGPGEHYELVAVATGINSQLASLLGESSSAYRPPRTVDTYICEFELGRDRTRRYLGPSMHVFLMASPRIEFAALIPKGEIVTFCMLGHEIDSALVESFLDSPEVRRCLPEALRPLPQVCQCFPLMNSRGAVRPFADRLVVLGDAGVTRLYKDGIGAAYRTAKAAATTAAHQGISGRAFAAHYWPTCRSISRDNSIGKLVFGVNEQLKKRRFTRGAIYRMVAREQAMQDGPQRMSRVLWDLFTGSAPYREVLRSTMHPGFIGGLTWSLARGLMPGDGRGRLPDVTRRAR